MPFFQGKAEFGEIYPQVDKYCSKPVKIAEAGATLLSVRAPVGPTNLAKEKSCIGRGLAAIYPLGNIDPKFALFLFRSIEPNISDKGTGSTFKAITKAFVEELEFGLPPFNEQQRIVAKIEELFSELDKGIESLKTAREQLKVYRQAVLKHAFEGKLTAKWREENKDKLESPEQLLARIQQEREARYQQQLEEWKAAVKAWEAKGKEGKKPGKPKKPLAIKINNFTTPKNFPNGWIRIQLRELFESTQNGLAKRQGTSGKLIPVIRLADIKSQAVDSSDLRSIKLDAIEIQKYELSRNDLLCIRVNGSPNLVGRMILFKHDNVMAYCDHFIRFRFPQGIVLPSYIQMLFDTQTVRRYIELNKVSSAGQNTVSQTTISALAIPYCSLMEQKIIVSRLEEQLTSISAVKAEIEENFQRLESLRQSILKKAFSGQLVPQDPKDEPASKLLERIRAEKEKMSNPTRRARKPAASRKPRRKTGIGEGTSDEAIITRSSIKERMMK